MMRDTPVDPSIPADAEPAEGFDPDAVIERWEEEGK
jgi:hypothetical protein